MYRPISHSRACTPSPLTFNSLPLSLASCLQLPHLLAGTTDPREWLQQLHSCLPLLDLPGRPAPALLRSALEGLAHICAGGAAPTDSKLCRRAQVRLLLPPQGEVASLCKHAGLTCQSSSAAVCCSCEMGGDGAGCATQQQGGASSTTARCAEKAGRHHDFGRVGAELFQPHKSLSCDPSSC